MLKKILTLQTPFQNLKLITTVNKIFGLLSCKLVKGRLKPSACGRYYCVLWTLIYCVHLGMFYYYKYIAILKEGMKGNILFDIVRYSIFIASTISCNYMACFQEQEFVKFSNKLEMYDDKAKALGHERKDKHIFIWLYFVITTCDLSKQIYDNITENVATQKIIEDIFRMVIGIYDIFIISIFLNLIGQRFYHLNKIIIPNISQLPVTGSPGEITVYDVRYLHRLLIDSADQINKMYAAGSFFISFNLLLEYVIHIYKVATTSGNRNEVENILQLFYETVYFYAMYQFVTYEANRVEYQVLKYGLSFQNKKYRMDNIEMMLYFYHRRYTFTAADFFILNLNLILSILLAAVTYVTILS